MVGQRVMWQALTRLLIVSDWSACGLPPAQWAPLLLSDRTRGPSVFDWSGWYFWGPSYGYATGYSRWSASASRRRWVHSLSGSLDLTNPTQWLLWRREYFEDLQSGYNQTHWFQSRVGALKPMCGSRALRPVSMGAQTFAAPRSGQASYQDSVAYSGTVRGRVSGMSSTTTGCFTAPVEFAFAYDKLRRTQLVGMPANGDAQAGTVQNGLMWRPGWVLGAGLEATDCTALDRKG